MMIRKPLKQQLKVNYGTPSIDRVLGLGPAGIREVLGCVYLFDVLFYYFYLERDWK
jgi:hypothetical protein